MKKIITWTMLLIILSGMVIAGTTLAKITKDKEIENTDFDLLAEKGATNWTVSPLNCDEDTCDAVTIDTGYGKSRFTIVPYEMRCLSINETTEQCQANKTKVMLTIEELETKLEAIEDSYRERIIKRIKLNKEKEEKVAKTNKIAEKEIKYKSKSIIKG